MCRANWCPSRGAALAASSAEWPPAHPAGPAKPGELSQGCGGHRGSLTSAPSAERSVDLTSLTRI